MKTTIITMKHKRLLALGLAMGAGLMTAGTTMLAAAETDHEEGFMPKVEHWQDKMSDAFRDAWKSIRGSDDRATMSTASVDLREQKKSYTIRLNLPGRDLEKVNVEMKGDSLHILAPAEGKVSRYEEIVSLAGAAPDAKLKIERKDKDGMLVITVPKATAKAGAPDTAMAPAEPLLPLSDMEREFLGRMDRMRREMDRIFKDSFEDFRIAPDQKGYFDEFNFGSSVDLKDEGDHYVVTAYLPERDMENVSATVENGTLKIEAKEETTNRKTDDKSGNVITHKAQFLQVLTLPGPVNADKMTVERKNGVLTVTLPKA